MFAGPNGSGKSTLKEVLPPELLGAYLNPDEIERDLVATKRFDLSQWGVSISPDEAIAFFQQSSFLTAKGLAAAARNIRTNGDCLDFSGLKVNSYFASVAVELLRNHFVGAGASFTIETVMSHPSKVALLRDARTAGFRTYLYYVATEDPAINVSRVKNRARLGGHDVPEDKVRDRYHRSLVQLIDAIKQSSRAYIFDNSQDSAVSARTWLAEITDGSVLELKTDSVPAWFKKYVLDEFETA